jgi:hypothetical protein
MKIKFKIAAMLAAVALFSITSCNKTPEVVASDEVGGLKINLELPTLSSDTKATPSTAKPVTSWAKSVKTMMILFVNPTSNLVTDARSLSPSTASNLTATEYTLTNIAAGPYNVYVIANYDQAGFNYTTNPAWTIANVKGKDITAAVLGLNLASHSGYVATQTENGHLAFSSPAEVFVATQLGVTVVADVTTDIRTTHPFALTRLVSMFRTRIISTSTLTAPSVGNDQVNFAHANADIRIRRVATQVNLQRPVPSATPPVDNVLFTPLVPVATQLVYSKGAFNTTNPIAADYTNPLTMLNGSTPVYKAWKDVMIFPGGHATTNSRMFELVISGWAPTGYIPLDVTTGAPAAALGAPALVYWAGIVEQKAILRNQILEVDLVVNSAGYNNPPTPGSTGNLIISVSLVDWGNIVSADIIL